MTLQELKDSLPQKGIVQWIGVRPERYQALSSHKKILAIDDRGLQGDHYQGKPGSKRQVTLIQKEHLTAVASYLGEEKIDPGLVRRNLVIEGINLNALKDRRFKVGEVLLQGTGECTPCSRMEKNLGPGGWNAMRGHGGITAQVIKGGEINIGDEVKLTV